MFRLLASWPDPYWWLHYVTRHFYYWFGEMV